MSCKISPTSTFVINRTDAIGDTLLTLPLATVLKKKLPNVKIIFIVSGKVQNLLDICQDVDEVWQLERDLSLKAQFDFLRLKFKSTRVDFYLYAGGSHFPSLMAFYMGVPHRLGLVSRWPSFLFLNKGVRQKRSKTLLHEVHYNLELLSPIENFEFEDSLSLTPRFELTEEKKKYAFQTLINQWDQSKGEGLELDREIIIIHPGMTGHTLNWPTEFYAQLVDQLESKFPARFVFIISYTPSDQNYVRDFKAEIKRLKTEDKKQFHLIYFDGAVDGLVNYMALLSQASGFVGPSTGTTHLASFLKIPLIGIYSPIKAQSEKRWGPFIKTDQTKVLTPQADLLAQAQQESYDKSCMKKISVDQACKELINVLGSKTSKQEED